MKTLPPPKTVEIKTSFSLELEHTRDTDALLIVFARQTIHTHCQDPPGFVCVRCAIAVYWPIQIKTNVWSNNRERRGPSYTPLWKPLTQRLKCSLLGCISAFKQSESALPMKN